MTDSRMIAVIADGHRVIQQLWPSLSQFVVQIYNSYDLTVHVEVYATPPWTPVLENRQSCLAFSLTKGENYE